MRLAVLALSWLLAFPGLTAAQPFDTPEALLEAFYEPYFTGEFLEDETVFRSAGLQALYEVDGEITPAGEMGALNFDPYIDGQDYEITEFAIDGVSVDGNEATADVSFDNFGEPRTLTYELVFEEGSWKIDDVVSTNPDNAYRLSEIFAEATAFYE